MCSRCDVGTLRGMFRFFMTWDVNFDAREVWDYGKGFDLPEEGTGEYLNMGYHG